MTHPLDLGAIPTWLPPVPGSSCLGASGWTSEMSVLLEELSKGGVSLERYGHQVGGHHLLFKFKNELCKPVQPREHFFYQTAPEIIKRFIPAYYGVINVNYIHHEDTGDFQVVAYLKPVQPEPIPPSLLEATSSLPQGKVVKCSSGKTIHIDGTTVTSKHSVPDSYKNPWAVMCSKTLDTNLKNLGNLDGVMQDYMILENLTSKFHSPCILDLKVGTRQHGDDATAIKVLKHTKSCAISTSRTLGVRLSGMQRFNVTKNEYTFYDKYFGKVVKEEEFSKILFCFLHNGVSFRADLLHLLISMLEDLQASVRALPTFRYYSSSLIIIYDGAVCPEGLNRVIPVSQEVDFEGITERAKEHSEEDFAAKERLHSNGVSDPNSYYNHRGRENSPPSPTLGCSSDTKAAKNEEPLSRMSGEELALARCHVDLRMIDFAHSTHSGFMDPIKHAGYDHGYLKGLDTLLRIFKELKRTYCDNSGCGTFIGESVA